MLFHLLEEFFGNKCLWAFWVRLFLRGESKSFGRGQVGLGFMIWMGSCLDDGLFGFSGMTWLGPLALWIQGCFGGFGRKIIFLTLGS